jgi:hypothetical protein
MLKLSPQLTGIVSSLWAVVIGASTQIEGIAWWGHYAIVAAGILLAGLGVNTTSSPSRPTPPPKGTWT